MPRYKKDYTGERRSTSINFQLTPTERKQIEAAAEAAGAGLSEYARELCLRRSTVAAIIAGVRRNPEARALMRQLTAIGNNLNQLARVANTARAVPQLTELQRTTDFIKAAMARVLEL
jgi:Bacterial mobilisation protein (MobC)